MIQTADNFGADGSQKWDVVPHLRAIILFVKFRILREIFENGLSLMNGYIPILKRSSSLKKRRYTYIYLLQG